MNSLITSNTIVDLPRLEVILKLLKETRDIPGDIAEVGVYRGGTAYLLCGFDETRVVHLFDTFSGMPAVDKALDLHETGDFSDTSIDTVATLLKEFSNVTMYPGLFPSTAEPVKDKTFSLVHLDCDIYSSVKAGLEFFYPRLEVGGCTILDDYNEPNCPGAKKAADEYVEGKLCKITPTVQSQAIVSRWTPLWR